LDPLGFVALMIPIVALLIPIVAMLTKHQQSMAEILHGSGGTTAELDQMRYEIQELKNLVNQQTLTIDNLDSKVRSLPDSRVTNSV
jgi:hypothetical protein